MNKEAEVKKFFTVLIIMSVLSLFVGARSSLAYGELNVEISDNYIGHSPQYYITFVAPSSLKKGENLTLTFDECVYVGENIKGNIILNGETIDNLTSYDNVLGITLPFDLNSGDTLQITIARGGS
jgi:hypothetical protein